MIEIFDVTQGSDEWFRCRLGIPTASNFGKIMAKGEGKVRRAYLLQLAAERLTGERCEPDFTASAKADMQRGKEQEPAAREAYTWKREAVVQQVGFIKNDIAGYSPDGLVGDDGLLEIKSRRPDLLIGTILKGEFPSEYYWQCCGGLMIAERTWIDLVNYAPGLPLFITRLYYEVAMDDIRLLGEEIVRFNEELERTVAKIKRYGGMT